VREVYGAILALVAEGFVMLAVGVASLSSSCLVSCGPSGSPPVWNLLVAIPLAAAGVGLMYYAAHQFMPPGARDRDALALGIASSVGFGLSLLVLASLSEDDGTGAISGLVAFALATGWVALTAFVARRVAYRA